MKCPQCSQQIHDSPIECICNDCGLTVRKVIFGRKLTPEILYQLFTVGRTPLIEGFISSKKKPFSAFLAIKGKKVVFEFPVRGAPSSDNKPKRYEENLQKVRVAASDSGTVELSLTGAFNAKKVIQYGHISARAAECLGLMTAFYLIKGLLKDKVNKVNLALSINNLELSLYLLKERTPRDIKMRVLVESAWKLLDQCQSWQATYEHFKRPRLEGGPQADNFPWGVFPAITVDVEKKPGFFIVTLPEDRPDVLAQFKASFSHSKNTSNNDWEFTLPGYVEKRLETWLGMVRGDKKETRKEKI